MCADSPDGCELCLTLCYICCQAYVSIADFWAFYFCVTKSNGYPRETSCNCCCCVKRVTPPGPPTENLDIGANVDQAIIVQPPSTPPPSYESIALDLNGENKVPEKMNSEAIVY
ncbi:unnamed protein product [Ceutorhynchus assimilis]|uniref:Uncharacterized protein n=1 Tax=Ceutorhynchus assimilis TaxID=467358 RepID=A0A9N9MSI9_9CUCU|nr:unnamed protein product [Ceutorhynchus assimilis]